VRSAHDLPSAKQALDHRIRALAQAHDLLTSRSWTGANLNDLAVRTLEAFAPTQVTMFGDLDQAGSHSVYVSQPKAVAAIIEDAARGVSN
jgi:two-component sensor histidine kinase